MNGLAAAHIIEPVAADSEHLAEHTSQPAADMERIAGKQSLAVLEFEAAAAADDRVRRPV